MKRLRKPLATALALTLTLFAAPAFADEPEPPSPVPWVLVGVGGAGVVLSGLFALLSASAHGSAEGAATHADAVAQANDAQTFAHVANALFVTGAAIAALGIGWLSVELTRAERHGGASASLELGPTSLTLRGAF